MSRVTRGCGLALFWKHDINLIVEDFSLNYIDVVINRGKENSWRFTQFYGFPKTSRHQESWDILRRLQLRNSFPNEITRSREKLGGRLRSSN